MTTRSLAPFAPAAQASSEPVHTDDPLRRHYRALQADAELAAELRAFDVDELLDTAKSGHPADLREAALTELRRRQWSCFDCGAKVYEAPADYDDRDYEDGPLCHDCARNRFTDTHVCVRARTGEQSYYIARPFVEVPF